MPILIGSWDTVVVGPTVLVGPSVVEGAVVPVAAVVVVSASPAQAATRRTMTAIRARSLDLERLPVIVLSSSISRHGSGV
jgi:hypothetical protein